MRDSTTVIRKPLAAAVLAALQAATMQAHAAGPKAPQQLPKISVGAEAESSYKPDIASSPKYTEALRDTPQTITIIPQQLIEDQKLLTMREILSTVPGITFGAGEGGGGYGDSITLRGFTGSSDITIDGVRDSAQYTRSDPFNLEQVEVINGASSVYSGAGSIGGSINLVTKHAQSNDFATFNAGVGTDNYGRFTADTNQTFGEHSAVRVNAMVHRNDVAGRDYEKFERWGLAPSLAFGLGTDTTVTLNYVHQTDDNIPQYGVPFFNGRPLPGVDSSNYYGYHNIDRQEIDTDALTAIIDHRFSDTFSLRNLSRLQQIEQLSVVDASQGTWCLPSNQSPTGQTPTGAACESVPVGQYMPSGPRGHVRDTTNRILYNQTDFTGTFATGAIEHTVVTGFSFAHETFTLDTSNDFRNADGTNPFVAPAHLPYMDLYNPDSRYNGSIHRTLTGKTDGELDNAALYVFDTLEFNEQWQFNAGVRYERNEGSSTTYIVQPAAANGGLPAAGSPAIGAITGANAPAKNDDDLLSYRAGLIFKPQENGTIYFSYGNSKTPSKASVNGSCNAVQTVTSNVPQFNANCNVDAETAVNYELGAKWDLLDEHLALTAAIFRNDRKNYRVNDPDPTNLSAEQALDGQARVDGIILGAGGSILENWAVSANYAYLDSEVLQGASNFSAAQGQDYTKGDPLVNVPKHSFSLWTTYELPFGLQLGYGATYQGEIYVTQHSSTNVNGPLVTASGYTIHRLMAGYTFNDSFDLQLNINNVLDKEYYTRIRNNGWATPGEGRLYILSANYSF
jgi:catecholate siderophore receptor